MQEQRTRACLAPYACAGSAFRRTCEENLLGDARTHACGELQQAASAVHKIIHRLWHRRLGSCPNGRWLLGVQPCNTLALARSVGLAIHELPARSDSDRQQLAKTQACQMLGRRTHVSCGLRQPVARGINRARARCRKRQQRIVLMCGRGAAHVLSPLGERATPIDKFLCSRRLDAISVSLI